MLFNKYHLELRPGEIFLTNIAKSTLLRHLVAEAKGAKSFRLVLGHHFKWFRAGNFAYTRQGKFMKRYRPIFVFRGEYDELMKK